MEKQRTQQRQNGTHIHSGQGIRAAAGAAAPTASVPTLFLNHQQQQAQDETSTCTVDFEHQPKFTAEDDKRDLQSLTIDDLVRLKSDLTGMKIDVTQGAATVQNQRHPAMSQENAALLASLDQEISKLPTESTSSYYQAVKRCPLEVSAERRLAFLECDANNATLAAKRLARYWDIRLELFGPEKCYQPMILAGAMAGEMVTTSPRARCISSCRAPMRRDGASSTCALATATSPSTLSSRSSWRSSV